MVVMVDVVVNVMMMVNHHVVGFRRIGDRLHVGGGDAGGKQERRDGGDGDRSQLHGKYSVWGLMICPLAR